MQAHHYDAVVIGGGSGGLAFAERAAEYGRRVALIEARALGGTCVNDGCVPKKIMWYAAQIAHAVDDARGYGIDAERGATDWRDLVERREAYIEGIREYWQGQVAARGIDRIEGRARFVDRRTVAVDGQAYSADHIVVATGGRPVVPALPGAEHGITSDGFFALAEQPRRVAIVGAGYIGVELAGMLDALGSQVTLLAIEARVLAHFDAMIGEVLGKELRAQGVDLRTGFRVTAIEQTGDGLRVRGADGESIGGFDTLIWAVGRRANIDGLDLEAAGIEASPGGLIPVDDFDNTAAPGIYAIGDVTGRAALTPVAIAAGRKLAARLFADAPGSRVDYGNIPSVVFAHPPVGTVGLTEADARARFPDDRITVYTSEFTPMRYALAAHGPTTAMKLVCVGDDERVAGIHLVGDQADEILQGFAVALKLGATKADLDATIAIHPTSAEELVTMKLAAPVALATAEPGWREAS